MPEEEKNEEKGSFAEKISFWFFLSLVFFLPIAVFPFGLSLEINKAYLAYFLILASFISWLIGRIQSGIIIIPRNWVLLSLIFLILFFLISSIFSQNPRSSLFGLGGEISTFAAFVFFSLALFLASQIFNKNGRVGTLIFALLASYFFVFLFQVLHIIFGFSIFPSKNFFPFLDSNLIGGWFNFAVFSGIPFIFSVYLFTFLKHYRLKFLFLAFFFLSFTAIVSANFKLLWLILGAMFVIFISYSLTFNRKLAGILNGPLLFGLMIVTLFIVTPGLAANMTSFFNINAVDVRPSFNATLEVIRQNLGENLILGSGPNTFNLLWFKYRPQSVNLTPFWSSDFEQGASFFSTIPAEIGFLGILGVLFFAGSFLFEGFRFFRFFSLDKDILFPALSFFGAFYYFLFFIFYSPNFLNIIFGFIFLGIFIGLSSEKNFIGRRKIVLFKETGAGFISGFILILLFIVSVSGIYFFGQKYLGTIYFQRGLSVFNTSGDLGKAKENMLKAINLDPQARYYWAITRVNLAELNRLLGRQDLNQSELLQSAQSSISEVVQNGQKGLDLAPRNYLSFLNLGQIYESMIPLQIDQALELARQTYAKAELFSPSHPDISLSRARVEIQAKKFEEAKKNLDRALTLKPDYAKAHFLYSQLEVQMGNLKNAIQRAETTVLFAPNDIGSLFQLGLLYYQDNQFENAKRNFERAVSLNQNYSNARYFLGLIYNRQGDSSKAIEEFKKISILNPDNGEIKKIIANLKSGKEPLSEISPPAEKPEKRKELPIEKQQ